jgi:hypothetical protein
VQVLDVRGLVGGGEVEHELVNTRSPVLVDAVRFGVRAAGQRGRIGIVVALTGVPRAP